MKTLTETVDVEDLRTWCRGLRESVVEEGSPFYERDLLAAESFRETEGEPLRITRVARATSPHPVQYAGENQGGRDIGRLAPQHRLR